MEDERGPEGRLKTVDSVGDRRRLKGAHGGRGG